MAPTAQDPTFAQGHNVTSFVGSIARTDTAAKTLFTLPANFIPTNVLVAATGNSDAGTTATISVGKSGGSGTEILSSLDVKTAGTGKGSQKPSASGSAVFGITVGTSPYVVTGIYAETGAASANGGPWLVIVEGLAV